MRSDAKVNFNSFTWNASSNSSTRLPLPFVGVAIAETGGEASFIGVCAEMLRFPGSYAVKLGAPN